MAKLMNLGARILLFVSVFALSALSHVCASTYDLEIPPRDNFNKAAFRFWLPDNVTTVKGVAVLVPGVCGDGRSAADEQAWQSFARANNFALLGCYLSSGNESKTAYYQANYGAGAAVLDSLKLFAEKSGHPEVENAPLVLWGHSAGGQFNYEFACWNPTRVIAFIVNKGGYYFTNDAPSKTLHIPALFFIGANDQQNRIQNIKKIFSNGRSQRALWALAVEPNAGHEIGGTQDLAISFFNTIIPLRLAEGSKLVNIKEDSGWTGNIETFEIGPMSNTNVLNSWLPNETMAKRWQAFVKGGSKTTP